MNTFNSGRDDHDRAYTAQLDPEVLESTLEQRRALLRLAELRQRLLGGGGASGAGAGGGGGAASGAVQKGSQPARQAGRQEGRTS